MTTKKMSPWKRFTGLLQLDRRDIRQIFYYAVFAGIVALSLPLGIQAIINLLQGAQITSSWIVLVALVTLGVAFQGGLQIMQIRILENIQQKIFMRSSFEFVYRFPKIKYTELVNYYPPELANRFFDTLTVQKGLSKILIDFPAAVLQIIFGIILLSFYHSFFIIYGILLLLLIYVVFKFTAKKGLETSLKESKSKYKVAHWIQEIARSLVSFKLSGNTSLAMQRNDELTTEYLQARESHFKILLTQFIQMIGFKVLVTAGLLVIGGLLVLNQQMNIGQFVAAEIIILLVISSVEKLIYVLETFYDVLTSLEKIGQVVDKKIEPSVGIDPFENEENFKIELEKVSFVSVRDKKIINNINLSIKDKERILLTGKSGSGKTTLLKLIAGIHTPTAGSIYINNSSIKGIRLGSYRSKIGQVLPEQQTFEGTILENITFNNPEISRKRLNEVLEKLGLLPFIKEQTNGLQTVLSSQGKELSFSISKRILLARAIVHQPKLLLLKDPLEYFDPEEAKEIINYLTNDAQNWSIVIVTNNPLWKTKCSKTLVLNQGNLNIQNHA
ncbi:peptidase domain-containing ABC transporter [Tenacibaculum sp. SG-28]|uniref:peptidase domain-containing ABC transporter n=1 Tax=Tenacibaculum sp. SG-28 TaxID=754426 RepID=UPI000CF36970|nr:ATP-binding cassette domain-containing protein [Tenacibaculum sp. SG-28]PQJ23441.1 ABC transporter ATP-binding protein/permease [Tenacibaculum sp. SG-28]